MSDERAIDRLSHIAKRIQEIQSELRNRGNVLDALVGIHSAREALAWVASAMIGATITDLFAEATASTDKGQQGSVSRGALRPAALCPLLGAWRMHVALGNTRL